MQKIIRIGTLAVSAAVFIGQFAGAEISGIYHNGWIDFNKNGVKDPYEDPKVGVEQRIDNLLKQMTVEEKTCQLATLYGYRKVLKDIMPTAKWKHAIWKDGIANIDEHNNGRHNEKNKHNATPRALAENINAVQRFFVEETRLGIPADMTTEGIRGLCARNATSFPVQLAVGCAWDRKLVSEIGRVTAEEARALGYSNVYAPILDLARDPRWGRVPACYGEDPYLASALGIAMIKALQSRSVAATVKHYAVYSIPKGGRDGKARTDPHIAPRDMHMIYLRPFKDAFIKAGALGTMCSYNDYDGIPIGGSHYFLTELLRNKWGFKGYVVSDSAVVRYLVTKHRTAANYKDAVRQAVNAGLDVRTEFNPPQNYILPLRELIKEGKISLETLDTHVRRVLRVKFLTGLFDHPYVKDPQQADKILNSAEHRAVSLRASRESIVLLKNNGLLPLDKNKIKSIAVIGPNADVHKTWSGYGPPDPKLISVYDGIRKLAGDEIKVKYTRGCSISGRNWPASEILPFKTDSAEQSEINQAVELARQSDIVIVAVGDSINTVGESHSRTSLQLPGYQQQLVQAIATAGKPMIVVLINGRPLAINWIDRNVPAIIEAWFPGPFGGQAIAETIFGINNPGGKLSVTFPRTVGELLCNFPAKPGSQAGQGRKGDPNGWGSSRITGTLYPFGHGLSYTTFKYSNLKISPAVIKPGESVTVTLDVTNTGQRDGDEIVQLYLRDNLSSIITYEKTLCGFKRLHLKPGETKTANFVIDKEAMQLLDLNMHWVVEPGTFTVIAGKSSTETTLKGSFTVK